MHFIKKTILLSLASASLLSCNNDVEDTLTSNQEELPVGLEADTPFIERFTIDKNGKKKPLNTSVRSAKRAPSYYQSDLTIKELNKQNIRPGKRHGFDRLHTISKNGTERPSQFKDYNGDNNSKYWGIAVAQRNYGFLNKNNRIYKQYHNKLRPISYKFKTEVLSEQQRTIGGREQVVSVIEVGLRNRKVFLKDSKNGYEFTESRSSTVSAGVTTGVNIGTKVSSSFFGFAAGEVSTNLSFETNFNTSTERSTSRTSKIHYSPGHTIPKGKKCQFIWTRQLYLTTTKYKVSVKVEGDVIFTHPRRNGKRAMVFTRKGFSIFPPALRNYKTHRIFTVKNQTFEYEVKRGRCYNL